MNKFPRLGIVCPLARRVVITKNGSYSWLGPAHLLRDSFAEPPSFSGAVPGVSPSCLPPLLAACLVSHRAACLPFLLPFHVLRCALFPLILLRPLCSEASKRFQVFLCSGPGLFSAHIVLCCAVLMIQGLALSCVMLTLPVRAWNAACPQQQQSAYVELRHALCQIARQASCAY